MQSRTKENNWTFFSLYHCKITVESVTNDEFLFHFLDGCLFKREGRWLLALGFLPCISKPCLPCHLPRRAPRNLSDSTTATRCL